MGAPIADPRPTIPTRQSAVFQRGRAGQRPTVTPAGYANPRFAVAQIAQDSNRGPRAAGNLRSEEHTSELQSPCNLVCRLLLEKKKIISSFFIGFDPDGIAGNGDDTNDSNFGCLSALSPTVLDNNAIPVDVILGQLGS